MPPNAIVITSTRSQEDYDVNFAYVHHALDALQAAVDPIGSLFCESGHAAVHVCGQGFYSGCVALGVAFDPGWIYDSVARVLCVSELVRS